MLGKALYAMFPHMSMSLGVLQGHEQPKSLKTHDPGSSIRKIIERLVSRHTCWYKTSVHRHRHTTRVWVWNKSVRGPMETNKQTDKQINKQINK